MNYSAFDKSYPVSQTIKASLGRARSSWHAANGVLKVLVTGSFLLLIAGSLTLMSVALSEYARTNQSDALFTGLLFLGLNLAALALITYGFISFGKRALVYETFAQDNGFNFEPRFNVRNTNSFMFKMGYMQIARNAVTGRLGGNNFALFEYRYTTGNARYQGPVIFTVLALNTGKEFPHIVLENKRGNLVLGKTRPPIVESDTPFNENFKVYSDSGEIASASSILNPAVIDQLLQVSPEVDVELNGKDVLIFVKNTHNKIDKQLVEGLLGAAQRIKTN